MLYSYLAATASFNTLITFWQSLQYEIRLKLLLFTGAIDGKHVRMIQIKRSNYKKFFPSILMFWTNAEYKFIYIGVGSYERAGDLVIFKTSN